MIQVERSNSNNLSVNQLPDGSRVIVDSRNEKVFALNATAGAAWDACSKPSTLTQMTKDMQHSLNQGITEELAEAAVMRLQEHNLVKTSGSFATSTRREVLATLGAIALPLVVSLTMTEQRAHAAMVGSATPADQVRPDAHVSRPGDPQF